ncbi:MAG: MarR family transcriptional regulator, partial [Pseudomonadota bacterium]
ASHAINRAYSPHLAPLGLTYPQYITLTLLRDRDGQPVGALADALTMESSTLTPLIKRLEAHGHVERRRGTADELQVFVHLTPKGRDVLEAAPGITACMTRDTGLDDATLALLVERLATLTANLQAAAGTPTGRTKSARARA